jgi:hypothetical protein
VARARARASHMSLLFSLEWSQSAQLKKYGHVAIIRLHAMTERADIEEEKCGRGDSKRSVIQIFFLASLKARKATTLIANLVVNYLACLLAGYATSRFDN